MILPRRSTSLQGSGIREEVLEIFSLQPPMAVDDRDHLNDAVVVKDSVSRDPGGTASERIGKIQLTGRADDIGIAVDLHAVAVSGNTFSAAGDFPRLGSAAAGSMRSFVSVAGQLIAVPPHIVFQTEELDVSGNWPVSFHALFDQIRSIINVFFFLGQGNAFLKKIGANIGVPEIVFPPGVAIDIGRQELGVVRGNDEYLGFASGCPG